jgi:tRNA(Ile)-lysidine synthase
VAGRLFVRGALQGDRFDPLGMGGNTMPLADFFRGRRVPPGRRERTPLLCDQAGIIWVVGHRIAERVKATRQTEHVLCLSVSSPGAVPIGVK